MRRLNVPVERHGRTRILAGLAFLVACTLAQAGEIYRCVEPGGAVSYTNRDGPASAAGRHVASYQPEPNTPLPAYAVPSASEEIETRIARARELGYREGHADASALEQPATASD